MEENVKQIDCESVEELIQNLQGLPRDLLTDWIYRGESSARYTLLPSALRKEGRNKLQLFSRVKNTSGLVFGTAGEEFSAIVGFYERANYQGLYVPHLKTLQTHHGIIRHAMLDFIKNKKINPEYYELISLAQHYGIPTRFLDWTEEFYVAFFFAFRNAIYKIYKSAIEYKHGEITSDKVVIWALNRGQLQINNGPDPLLFITPCYNNNPNLAAQKGTFTYHDQSLDFDTKIDKLPIQPLDEFIKNMPDKYIFPVLYKLTLPYDKVPEGFMHIRKVGYTYSKIFPGYASSCKKLEDDGILRRTYEALTDTKNK